ncbi:serine/threonine-protein kinase [Myxococcus qinghaiensis]|uniref:serine/threonine-protein kinase n=1 Tax=Myxococcus qinghaiensis TaxID=2906758 RepID=UPI0020A831D2|nr:protein kinase [Myxococcus qinghaiensis]MCP3164494.1 serine/threonine protein kinase [Myxococcus qinghaiensis]
MVGLMEGRLETGARARVHHHAASCPACRELLVAVVRSEAFHGEVPTESVLAPERGPALGKTWEPPTELDEFRLMRLLGRGGMGAVYLAHDTSLDRLVALKLSVALQPDTSTLESFAIEARAIARIKHPNVVTVFRAGEVSGRPYLVYEYVEGKSLAELKLPLPWRYVLDIAVGLARGLRAAHQRGVLHRDLKPSNAILETDGTIKLLDFGLAAFVGTDRCTPWAVPGVVGTPRYMAPETRLGAPATPQSDLYALGLLLYELCTGTVPCASRQAPAVTGGAGIPLSERTPGIAPDFAEAIERCLMEEPARRFGRADALCCVLERLTSSGSDAAFPPARSASAPEPRPWAALNPV